MRQGHDHASCKLKVDGTEGELRYDHEGEELGEEEDLESCDLVNQSCHQWNKGLS